MFIRRFLAGAVLVLFGGLPISEVKAQEQLSANEVLLLCVSSHKSCEGNATNVKNKINGDDISMVEIGPAICDQIMKHNSSFGCSKEADSFFEQNGPKLMYIDFCPIGGHLCSCYFNSATGNTACQEL